jgi:hypothetical protein
MTRGQSDEDPHDDLHHGVPMTKMILEKIPLIKMLLVRVLMVKTHLMDVHTPDGGDAAGEDPYDKNLYIW